jgi:hypothetical protein
MAPITKFLQKTKTFEWTLKCQITWEAIKQRYINALIFIVPCWDLEFHIHMDASHLAISAMLAQNLTSKCDQLMAYASRLLNNAKKNYTPTKWEALVMVYTLHKFHHYLLGNKFIFYVHHMGLLYLIKKPQLFKHIMRWLLLCLEYDFSIIYKLGKSHWVADALSWLPNLVEPTEIPD